MKPNVPKSWFSLPKSEKEKLQNYLNEQLNEMVDNDEKELQEIWIKLACILLYENFGFREQRLLRFIAAWRRIYRRNARTGCRKEQTKWLEEEMAKCFPKSGFPQERIDNMKKD